MHFFLLLLFNINKRSNLSDITSKEKQWKSFLLNSVEELKIASASTNLKTIHKDIEYSTKKTKNTHTYHGSSNG